MKLFFRAVVTGFAWSLGSALFKKVQRKVGLGQPEPESDGKPDVRQDGAGDPHAHQHTMS